tara:strand:+ start:289 stop:507 length:219 start_codon:yes stop_codon:yes gene_type:complete
MKNKNKIKIILNGKSTSLDLGISVKKLIENLNFPLNKIAIEINKEIINKKRIKKIFLKNDDKVEIVHFIGGG